jgi:uncharacterized membrane protein YhiD involved in acid resistance
MAVGGGLYLVAIFATLLIPGVLLLLGVVERWMNLKKMVYGYEVTGHDATEITANVNEVLEALHFLMSNTQIAPTPRHVRVQFECAGTRKQQVAVLRALQRAGTFESVTGLGPVQAE